MSWLVPVSLRYMQSLANNLSFTRYKDVYSAAAEIIGLVLKNMAEKNEVGSISIAVVSQRIAGLGFPDSDGDKVEYAYCNFPLHMSTTGAILLNGGQVFMHLRGSQTLFRSCLSGLSGGEA